MSYQLTYNFQPGDTVFVLNEEEQSVHKGICTQVVIKVYKDSTNITPPDLPPVVEHIQYWVMLDNSAGSSKVSDDDAFATLEAALAALGAEIIASPTPTPSSSIPMSPSPTPTPSVTPTPSATPTL